ncbi:M20/M25/M40 family metallo-hydrolase [Niastella caeni]|uniref:M20/M25/M40 family metallo-hydrolase n=1 Tax=Niastella caeni TaxID=2569763 RepID=A0A4S8HPJ2_9BACT|nr:M20/M25/M40 family metallo-hydrolase [Niastella caeni]THU37233.1 M20/M25/M40 family metallo-hydrolase [Niastella caeni]
MRHSYIRFCLILFLSWNVTICSAQSISIDSIITPSSLKELVQTLSADSFQGRLTGTVQASNAALYISEAFKNAGALPIAGNDGYIMPFIVPDKITAFNVVAALPGTSKANELVIFGAHYDHIGTTKRTIPRHVPERGHPEKKDNIYNGANDNASGISGLIHLARYFAQHSRRERTLIFIAFSGEEEGLLGSKSLVESFDPKTVKAMINMDMIGRPISKDKKYPYVTGHLQSDLQAIFNKKLYELAPQYGEKYFRGDYFIQENLFSRSDNYPFAKKGIVAHTIITTSPNDQYYHSLNDEWETLDYPFMAEVVKAIALASSGLADGSDTP